MLVKQVIFMKELSTTTKNKLVKCYKIKMFIFFKLTKKCYLTFNKIKMLLFFIQVLTAGIY